MATIATCPECEQSVTVPAGVPPQARVRCPLCHAEYPLAAAIPNLPPQLQLLDAALSEAAAASWSADEEVEAEAWTPLGSTEIAVAGHHAAPHTSLEFGEIAGADFSTGRPGPDSVRGIPTMAPLPKPRHRSSAVRQLIGIVGGGVLGLGLGYIALLWIGGQSKDFLKVGAKLPAFMVPASFHAEDEVARATVDAPSQFDELAGKFDKYTSPNQPPTETPTPRKPRPHRNPKPVESEFALPPADESQDSQAPKNPLDDAPAEAAPLEEDEPETATPKVSIPTAEKFAPADLGAALGAALKLREGMEQGTLADSKSDKIAAFKAYCDLAHVATFVAGKDSEEQLGPRKTAARDLVQRIADNEQAMLDVAQLSNLWITSAKRTKPGVLLAGKVLEMEKQGDAFALIVSPFGHTSQFKIISPTRPNVAEGSRAVLIGSIIDDPSTIVGYEVDVDNQLSADNLADPSVAPKVIYSQIIVVPRSDAL